MKKYLSYDDFLHQLKEECYQRWKKEQYIVLDEANEINHEDYETNKNR